MSEHRESWRIEKELKEQQTKIQKVQENISALLSYIENDNFLMKNKVFDKEQLKQNIEEYNRRLEEDKITLKEYEKQLTLLLRCFPRRPSMPHVPEQFAFQLFLIVAIPILR